MSHPKSAYTLGYITILFMIGFADCKLITMRKWDQSCFLEIQIFRFSSKTVQFLSNFLRDNSLQLKPHTWTIGDEPFQESLNNDGTFYINCKSLCNIHVYVQPYISKGYLEHYLDTLQYTRLILVTKKCLRRFSTPDFTTTNVFVHSLGCRKIQPHNVPNGLAILVRAITFREYVFKMFPIFRDSKPHSFHYGKIEITGHIREYHEGINSATDTDLIIAKVVMKTMNISVRNLIGNIYTSFSPEYDGDRGIIFKLKLFSRIIQEQIVYCPKHKNHFDSNDLSFLFLFESFYSCVWIAISITLATFALYLIIAGKRQSGILKQIEMFTETLFIVFAGFMGQKTVNKSVILVLLAIASLMLVSTYKDSMTVRLVSPHKTLQGSFKNLSDLVDHDYHRILCPTIVRHYTSLPNLDNWVPFVKWKIELIKRRSTVLDFKNDDLLSEFLLSNLLNKYENSSLINVGFYVIGKGDVYNGKSFEMNNFLKRKTNCNSLENALFYESSYIVYNTLRYLEAFFITRVLQESGVSRFIERMEMHKKYEINNWNSMNRPLSVRLSKHSGGFRLSHQIRPFAILLFGMVCLDLFAFSKEVYATRWMIWKNLRKSVPMIKDGCFGIYSYVFDLETAEDKYVKATSS